MTVNDLIAWDQAATLWINQHHHVVLDALLLPVSYFGEAGVGWIAIMLALLIFGKRRERLLTLVCLAGLLLTEFAWMPLFRQYAFRPRPYTYLPGVRLLGVPWAFTSFPSGHAHLWAQATIFYGRAYRRWLWPLIVLSALTCYSRPYVGAHHVLDVVAGLGLGGVMGLVEVAVAARLGLMGEARGARGEESRVAKRGARGGEGETVSQPLGNCVGNSEGEVQEEEAD